LQSRFTVNPLLKTDANRFRGQCLGVRDKVGATGQLQEIADYKQGKGKEYDDAISGLCESERRMRKDNHSGECGSWTGNEGQKSAAD